MNNVSNLSDEEVVNLVCYQDQELYAEIVRRYQDKLLRYADYLVQDQDKAADVVQQAFIKAFINLRGFNIRKKFSSWIYRIVHNEAVNFIKRSQREVALTQEYLEHKDLDNWDSSVEDELVKQETKEELIACLDNMPLAYREPLALFYLEERSYQEISDILRLPIGTVGTRMSRGRSLLRSVYLQGKDQTRGSISQKTDEEVTE